MELREAEARALNQLAGSRRDSPEALSSRQLLRPPDEESPEDPRPNLSSHSAIPKTAAREMARRRLLTGIGLGPRVARSQGIANANGSGRGRRSRRWRGAGAGSSGPAAGARRKRQGSRSDGSATRSRRSRPEGAAEAIPGEASAVPAG